MLLRLEIRNIALIDEVGIELGDGLNILTGETGAGKSIIIDSINMLLGERFSRELIRTGQEKANLEAVFNVDNQKFNDIYEKYGIEPESDGTLIISREYSVGGRSICRINGRIITLSILKEIGGKLIDVHGQYDNQSLLKKENHIELLDAFGGEVIGKFKNEYFQLFTRRKEIKNSIRKLMGDEKDRERKIDLLKYQINEIKSAKLKIKEDEELTRQKTILYNSGKIADAIENVYNMLYLGKGTNNSVYDEIVESVLKLESICSFDDVYSKIRTKLEDIEFQMEDIRDEIRNAKENIEYNPFMLEQIEERLDLIYKLKKKYGYTLSEVIQYYQNSEKELNTIIKSEEYINKLQRQLIDTESSLYDIAVKINKERTSAATLLENKICKELAELEMRNASFKVSIQMNNNENDYNKNNNDNSNNNDNVGHHNDNHHNDNSSNNYDQMIRFTENGLDKVEFLISSNAGEPLKPLSKIASGGEMARIMLAIKAILADVDQVPTLIFDEIDIGISGKASQRVGEKLSYISKTHQVICVTHQAQIACMADNHYLIEKFIEGDSTKTKVCKISDEKVIKEVSRILGGDAITLHTKNLAIEMLENARKFK